MRDIIQGLNGDIDAIAKSLRESTVTVVPTNTRAVRKGRGGTGQGAGIVWSIDGTIVTNAHVATSDYATVRLFDGREVGAKTVLRDEQRDIALLQADISGLATPLTAANIGEPSKLRAGDVVLALGHPLGVEGALAMGVVHAAPRPDHSPYVVADIKLAPGNSGGPLTDVQGRVVGVNSMIVGGLGVAVSVDVVRGLLSAATPRPMLGAQLRPVRVRVPVGSTESTALLVLGVDPKGAAARSGILQGDLLFGHAGRPFKSANDLARLLRDAGAGARLRLDVGRAGKKIICDVTLGAAVEAGRRAA